MAGWTVEYASGVGGALEFIDMRRNVDIPQFIECRFQQHTYLESIKLASCSGPGTMRDRRSTTELDRRQSEPRDTLSPRVSHCRFRTNSADADELVGLRLSLAGLRSPGVLSRQNRKLTSAHDDALLDELHSDPYSSVMEKLRLKLGNYIPSIDEVMISKAVIHAFSTDPSSKHCDIDKFQIEVELLCRAQQWACENLRAKDESAQQEFLQQCLDEIFLQIHREHLSSSNGSLRIVLNVCSILGLEIINAAYVRKDTVLLQGLPRTTTRQALHESLATFGPIDAIAISTENPGFAYCRFNDEASASQVVEDRSTTLFGGSPIRALLLGESSFYSQPIIPESPSRTKFEASGEIKISPICVWKQTDSSFTSSSHDIRRSTATAGRQDAEFSSDSYAPLPFLS